MTAKTPKGNNSLASKFVREISFTGLGVGSAMIFSLIVTVILARYLPRQDYGVFLLLLLITDFLAMLSAFGLDSSVIPVVARAAEEDRGKIASTVILFRLGAFGLVTIIYFLGQSWFLLLLGGSDIGQLGVFVPLLLVTSSYRNLLRALMRGFFCFKRMAAIDFVTSALNLVLILVFVLVLRASFAGLMLAQAASQGFACLALYWALPGPKRLHFDFAQLGDILRIGWPLQLNDLLNYLSGSVSSLIVAGLVGPGGVALLSIAGKPSLMIRRLFESFRSVYLPNMSKLLGDGDRPQALQLLNTSLRLTSFVLALGALVAVLFGDEIIVLLFSEQYRLAATAFVLAMVSLNIGLLGNIMGTSLVATGKAQGVAAANTTGVVVGLLASLVCIPFWGVDGAALAGVLASAAATPINIVYLRRQKINPLIADSVKPLIIVAILAGATLVMPTLPWGWRVLLLLLYLVLCWATAVIRSDDVSQGRAVVRSLALFRNRAKVVTS